MIDKLIRKMLYGNLHDIGGVDGTDDAGPVEGSLSVFYAGGLKIGNNRKVLPYLSFKAVLCELLTKDCV